jgi:hypothetical protein
MIGKNIPPVSPTHIFSKAQEFGSNENEFNKKINFLGNLLSNYNGLNGMKDDFAKMLYASS